ncbi:response regulator [Gordonia sp. NPDC003424]
MTARRASLPARTRCSTPVRVVLADDHVMLRESLRCLLDRHPQIDVVGEAGSTEEAFELITGLNPDVAVVDLKLVGAQGHYCGLDLIERLAGNHPAVASLLLTTFLDERVVAAAADAGARGCVVKDVDTTRLVTAVLEVAAGHLVFTPPNHQQTPTI